VGVYWSPYSVGRWCYRALFGWTWVSYEPWGWLPYHYGRWHRSAAYGWCWLPGPAFAFNFWSPGLVAFYSGPGWVSWCPLGPGDYYDTHHYHYNRGIYGHQLNELARLNKRDRGHLFNRDASHAFRTVSLDRFRDGSFRGRDQDPDRTDIERPWKRGELVRDNRSIRPTAASYRAVPDRQAAAPVRSRALPAVVRSNPAHNARSQENYSRITNPGIPSLPSRQERMERSREESSTVVNPRSTGRVYQTPQRDRVHPETANPQKERPLPETRNEAGRNSEEQNGRKMTTPRRTPKTEDSGADPKREEASPESRPSSSPSRVRQNSGQGRSEQAAPAPRQPNRSPSENKSNDEERHQSKPSEPRTRSSVDDRSEASSIDPFPRTNEVRKYSYRGTGSSSDADDATRSFSNRVYSAPAFGAESERRATVTEESRPSVEREISPRAYSNHSNSAPSYSIPQSRPSNEGGAMSSGRSSSSVERRSESRSYSAPSFSRGSERSSGASGRASSGGASGGFSGGAQKTQERGSSGGGRGRR
jgi:hypothetical protein